MGLPLTVAAAGGLVAVGGGGVALGGGGVSVGPLVARPEHAASVRATAASWRKMAIDILRISLGIILSRPCRATAEINHQRRLGR